MHESLHESLRDTLGSLCCLVNLPQCSMVRMQLVQFCAPSPDVVVTPPTEQIEQHHTQSGLPLIDPSKHRFTDSKIHSRVTDSQIPNSDSENNHIKVSKSVNGH
uniref:Uncharacterized protein n=1 Tax=Mucochytrium quahogii TaxID=96639 RepID=A0A7S2WHC6_9STRA|mmetsp:Transcript_1606/g.2493  ORF Transcript_1606/g.2493 Transcript_1606/m.2493 type:complete len:104 (+) Transcript_1606:2899-3210(+)